MKKLLLLTTSIAALSISGAFAGQTMATGKSYKETKTVIEEETCRFRDMEWQVDAFYTAFFGGHDTYFRSGSGGGFGVNFFFLRYFGIGYEAAWYDNAGTVEHLPLGFNGFLRFPICDLNIAPYAMVGVGGAWDGNGTAYGNVGGGIEYRFTDHIGVFCDGRFFYGGSGNVGNLRAGLRFAF